MPRKVYTYRSITGINAHPDFAVFKDYPHITATASLKDAVTNIYGNEIRNILNVNDLQRDLLSPWDKDSTIFQQYIVLSDIIREMAVPDHEKSVYLSFMKNRRDVLNSIRILVEADLSPYDIEPTSPEEAMFVSAWEELEIREPSFCRFRTRFASFFSDTESFRDTLVEKLYNQEAVPKLYDTIVLNGFYFITPIQERIFDAIETLGITLVFLCCIDPDLNGVESIWRTTLRQENGFPHESEWVSGEDGTPRKEFGILFDSSVPKQTAGEGSIKLIRYSSEEAFVKDINRIHDSELQLFGTDIKAVRTLLRDVYPDRFTKRHLLSYPVGQYIYQLHKMWDTTEHTLILDYDSVRDCFTSGWVIANGQNGRFYTDSLEKLKACFVKCRTFEDWMMAIAAIKETREQVLSLFEKHIDSLPKEHELAHRIMSDPFLNLSCFSISEEDLDTVTSLIKTIMSVANDLFDGSETINIREHLAKLRKLIESKHSEVVEYSEEEELITELLDYLAIDSLHVDSCLPDDISEAIMLIVGDGIIDKGEYQIANEESESPDSLVEPLYSIEAASVLHEKGIHLCLADEPHLPGRRDNTSWPLTNDLFDRISPKLAGRKAVYLEDMRLITEKAPEAKRYLFYSLVQNKNIEISWIGADIEKKIEPSPYILLLQNLYSLDIQEVGTGDVSFDLHAPYDNTMPVLSLDYSNILADEIGLDFALCPWRYFYGYICQDYPSYKSEFHYSFVLSRLIGALSSISGISKSVVAEEVLDTFPLFRQIEKQQITDYSGTAFDDLTDTLDDVSYPRIRLLPHFLQRHILNKAIGAIQDKEDGPSIVSVDPDSYNPDPMICTYCPFSDDCLHAIRSIDKESST